MGNNDKSGKMKGVRGGVLGTGCYMRITPPDDPAAPLGRVDAVAWRGAMRGGVLTRKAGFGNLIDYLSSTQSKGL